VILGKKNLFFPYKRKNRGKKKLGKKKIQNFPICPRDFPGKKPHPKN
jgi:hypothetical protein